jgi:hypothetical protein
MEIEKPSFISIINSDPTLKMIHDAPIDFNHFNHHINVKIAASKIAISKYVDLLIMYNFK